MAKEKKFAKKQSPPETFPMECNLYPHLYMNIIIYNLTFVFLKRKENCT